MADAAAVCVGEAAAIEELGRQPRRIEAAERRLRVGGVGQSEGADAAVAPGLALEPNERVETVLGLAQIFYKTAARTVAAAAILIGDGVAVPGEISGELGPGPRPCVRGAALGSARCRFIVGRAFQQHRKRPRPVRPVHIGRQQHSVARRHHQIALDDDLARFRHQPSLRAAVLPCRSR